MVLLSVFFLSWRSSWLLAFLSLACFTLLWLRRLSNTGTLTVTPALMFRLVFICALVLFLLAL